MSEAQTTPNSALGATAAVGEGASASTAPAATSVAASLFPEQAEGDGDATPVSPDGEATESGGSVASPSGSDTVAGSEGSDAIDPASYELTLPEGFTADEALLTSAREAFAAAGVSKDKAQSLIDLYAKAQSDALAKATSEFEAANLANLNTINAMPEFQGQTREKSLTAIGALVDEFGPELKAEGGLFNNPAIGNNPTLVRFLLKVANLVTEGGPVGVGRASSDRANNRGKTSGQILFGSEDPSANSINAPQKV